MFSTLPKTNFDFLFKFILSSANAFNLDQSKILSFGKQLTISNLNLSWCTEDIIFFRCNERTNPGCENPVTLDECLTIFKILQKEFYQEYKLYDLETLAIALVFPVVFLIFILFVYISLVAEPCWCSQLCTGFENRIAGLSPNLCHFYAPEISGAYCFTVVCLSVQT